MNAEQMEALGVEMMALAKKHNVAAIVILADADASGMHCHLEPVGSVIQLSRGEMKVDAEPELRARMEAGDELARIAFRKRLENNVALLLGLEEFAVKATKGLREVCHRLREHFNVGEGRK